MGIFNWIFFLIYSIQINLGFVQSLSYLQIGEECFPEERIPQQSNSNLSPFYDDDLPGNSQNDGSEPNLNLLVSSNYTKEGNESETLQQKQQQQQAPVAPLCDPGLPIECLAGRCLCKKGFTISRNGTKCLEIARNGLDSHCEESIQCWKGLLGRMSECNLDMGKCQCYESETLTMVYHRGRCSYGENIGVLCQIEGLCEATTANATCRLDGTCHCREGFIPSWDKSRCLPIATEGLNSTCEENIQCEKSQLGALSECNQDVMKCHCYKIPDMETVFHQGKCYFEAALGDVCQVSAQCQQKTDNSVCSRDGKCFCDDGHIPNGNNSLCLPIPSSDGVLVGSSSVDEATIVPPPPLPHHLNIHHNNNNNNGQCSDDSQCNRLMGPLSRCNLPKQKCECYLPENVHSFRPFQHNFPHHSHNNINNHQENSVSSLASTSQLAPNRNSKSNINNGINTTDVELLDQQLNWSGGISSPLLIMVGNKCHLGKELSHPCKYNKQCSSVTEGSWCDNGRCECLEESHVRSQDGRKCLKIVKKGLDSVCDEDGQCTKSDLGPLSQCNSEKKRCECKNSVMPVVFYKGRCFFHRQLGSSCESNVECQAGSGHLAECSSGRCRCGSGTIKLTPHLCGVNNTINSAAVCSYNGKGSLIIWKVFLVYLGILFGNGSLLFVVYAA